MDFLLLAIALSLSTNVDNLAIGIAYSTKAQDIPLKGNLIIALLSGLSTWCSMSIGDWVAQFLPATFSHWFGGCLLILIGSSSLWEQLRHSWNPSFIATSVNFSTAAPKSLSLQECWLLGLSLTVSNFGTGIGAGMAHLGIGLVTSLSVLTSLAMISGGTIIGNLVSGWGSDNRIAGWLTGMGLIALGAYEAIV